MLNKEKVEYREREEREKREELKKKTEKESLKSKEGLNRKPPNKKLNERSSSPIKNKGETNGQVLKES